MTGQAGFSLPRWRHIPGLTKLADHTPLEAAKATVPQVFPEHVPAQHPALLYGLQLHDESFFWEAHEVLEAVWMAAPKNGRDRLALRALIQIANAGLKRGMGKQRAAERLISEARDLLHEFLARGPCGISQSLATGLDSTQILKALGQLDPVHTLSTFRLMPILRL